MYKVTICNVPTCTCPDLKKNGMLVSSKHIIFVFLFVIKIDDETVSNTRHIGDGDIKRMLSKLRVEERFMKRSESILKKKDFLQILREHELYGKEQICTLHWKSKRSAKCSGCKNVLKVGALAVKVNGAISARSGKATAVVQVFYFFLKDIVLPKSPNGVM